jgi:hypothetical protein
MAVTTTILTETAIRITTVYSFTNRSKTDMSRGKWVPAVFADTVGPAILVPLAEILSSLLNTLSAIYRVREYINLCI